jgi:hypothetical protein
VEKFIREKLQNALNKKKKNEFKIERFFSMEQTRGSAYALCKLQLINLLISVYNKLKEAAGKIPFQGF